VSGRHQPGRPHRAPGRVAAAARLVVAEHGHHLDAFRATDEQVARLTSFLAG
jgi:hypothetical protein